jgi:rhodanese-related sulfurtransferase
MSSRPDRIDPEAAAEYLAEHRAIFVDARPQHAYYESGETLPDVVRVDPSEGAVTDEELLSLPRELLLIVFCDEPNQAASAGVARRARALGRGDASILDGGLRAWMAAGLPTVPLVHMPPTERVVEAFSDHELERLCHLWFWIGAPTSRLGEWGASRAAMERFLASMPRVDVERYLAFRTRSAGIAVPEEHDKRVANLPPVARDRALAVFGKAATDANRLAALLSADDSDLLLRWYTWTREIPPHQTWWYEGPTAPM